MFLLDNGKRIVVPRTELTYPGHNLRMHQNAAQAPADLVMADLEDACPYEYKGEPSRKAIVEAFNTLDFGKKVVTFRPNNIRSKFFLGDVEAVMRGAPNRFHGIILPKVTGPEDIAYVSRLLDSLEQEAGWTHQVQIESLIETPQALLKAHAIATASPRMAGLIFGIADFGAAMGILEVIEDQNRNFHYAKQSMAVAAKAAGLHAIDCVFFTLIRRETPPEEAERTRQAMRRKNLEAANLGMDGTWIIHPQQADIANECYSPTEAQMETGRKVIEHYHQMGGGAFIFPETGEFVDEATAKGYLVLLAKGVQAGRVEEAWLTAHAARHREITGYDILQMAGRRL
ncbi:MAG: CoA ester lyase [Chloroflexi bacterium]|nr:CoA ester lyase [Chloroflexota bacterium]